MGETLDGNGNDYAVGGVHMASLASTKPRPGGKIAPGLFAPGPYAPDPRSGMTDSDTATLQKKSLQ